MRARMLRDTGRSGAATVLGVALSAAALTAVTGCDGSAAPSTGPTPPISAQAWTEPDHYAYTLLTTCGERGGLGLFRVWVRDGQVERAKPLRHWSDLAAAAPDADCRRHHPAGRCGAARRRRRRPRDAGVGWTAAMGQHRLPRERDRRRGVLPRDRPDASRGLSRAGSYVGDTAGGLGKIAGPLRLGRLQPCRPPQPGMPQTCAPAFTRHLPTVGRWRPSEKSPRPVRDAQTCVRARPAMGSTPASEQPQHAQATCRPASGYA
jgi:hypothetical protein